VEPGVAPQGAGFALAGILVEKIGPLGFLFRFTAVASLSWFRTAFASSLIIALSSTAIAIVIGILAARALARHRFRGRAVVAEVPLPRPV
jgi:ABC-type spermidine/putrescine transport system permease subunit II